MTSPTPPNITKACSNCGKQKPLSAFLEMSGAQGATYGNICSSCRKTALEAAEHRKNTDAEGSTTSGTKHTIDTKSKVHDAIGKRETKQRIEDEYHAERKIDEEITLDKQEIQHDADAGQKKHRDDFLKKSSFLSGQIKRTPIAESPTTQAADAAHRTERDAEKAVATTHETKEEKKKKEHDFTVTNQGEQITGQIRFSGQAFQQFRQRIGTAAPIAKHLNKTAKESTPAKKEAGMFTESKEGKQQKDPAVQYIENNWRPGSKR